MCGPTSRSNYCPREDRSRGGTDAGSGGGACTRGRKTDDDTEDHSLHCSSVRRACVCASKCTGLDNYGTSTSDGGAETLVLGFLARRARPKPVGRRCWGERLNPLRFQFRYTHTSHRSPKFFMIFGSVLVFFRRDMSGRVSFGREVFFRSSSPCTPHSPRGVSPFTHDNACPAALHVLRFFRARDARCFSQRVQGCGHGGFRVISAAGWGPFSFAPPLLTPWCPFFFLYAQPRGDDVTRPPVSGVRRRLRLLPRPENTGAVMASS